MPRRYIRHPSKIPIEIEVSGETHHRALKNVSLGGLCTQIGDCPPEGASVVVRIPLLDPPFSARGHIVWCRCFSSGQTLAGICFSDPDTAYAVRMVEQVCHIESFRQRICRERGYDCGSEEAAREWIERYAQEFPPPEQDS